MGIRRRKLGIVIVLLLVLATGAWLLFHSREPTYEAKYLSTWLEAYDENAYRIWPLNGAEQKAADEANQAMIDHLTAQGIPRNQLANAFVQNPVLRTAEARQIAWKAQQYDRLMAAPKAVPVRQPQNVQRPGSSAPRSTSQNSSLAALNRQLDNATTEAQQLKIARQILEIRGAA